MDSRTINAVRKALRQRAEADQILGGSVWPVSREVLRRKPRTAKPAAPAARDVDSPASVESTITGDISDKAVALSVLDTGNVKGCTRCGLAETRTNTVFGSGNPNARIVFVGEAPGFDEDRSGLPFVGRAGELLTKMIEAGMGIPRDDVFICNVLKCRPPNNRTPAPDEIAACSPYLFDQIRIIQPEVIVALGAPAAQTLLNTRESIGRLRGQFHEFRVAGAAGDEIVIPLMPTYHPAYLLRSPGEKRKSWEDLLMVLDRLGLPKPATR